MCQPFRQGRLLVSAGFISHDPPEAFLNRNFDGKRTVDNRYYFVIDAIVLSPRGFKPNGVVKPF